MAQRRHSHEWLKYSKLLLLALISLLILAHPTNSQTSSSSTGDSSSSLSSSTAAAAAASSSTGASTPASSTSVASSTAATQSPSSSTGGDAGSSTSSQTANPSSSSGTADTSGQSGDTSGASTASNDSSTGSVVASSSSTSVASSSTSVASSSTSIASSSTAAAASSTGDTSGASSTAAASSTANIQSSTANSISSSTAAASSSTAPSSTGPIASNTSQSSTGPSSSTAAFVTPPPFPTSIPALSSSGGFSVSTIYSSSGAASSSTGGSVPTGTDNFAPYIDPTSISLSPSLVEYASLLMSNPTSSLTMTLTFRVVTGFTGLNTRVNALLTLYWDRFATTIGYQSDVNAMPISATFQFLPTPFMVDANGGTWVQQSVTLTPALFSSVWGQATNRYHVPPGNVTFINLNVTSNNNRTAFIDRPTMLASGGSDVNTRTVLRAFLYASPGGIYTTTNAQCVAGQAAVNAACGTTFAFGNLYFPSVCPSLNCATVYVPYFTSCLINTINNQNLVGQPLTFNNQAQNINVPAAAISMRALYQSCQTFFTPNFHYPPMTSAKTPTVNFDCNALGLKMSIQCQISMLGTGADGSVPGLGSWWYNFKSLTVCPSIACSQAYIPWYTNCLNWNPAPYAAVVGNATALNPYPFTTNIYANTMINMLCACSQGCSGFTYLMNLLPTYPTLTPLTYTPAVGLIRSDLASSFQLYPQNGGTAVTAFWNNLANSNVIGANFTLSYQNTSMLQAKNYQNWINITLSPMALSASVTLMSTAPLSNPFDFSFALSGSNGFGSFGLLQRNASFRTQTPFTATTSAPGIPCPASYTQYCPNGACAASIGCSSPQVQSSLSRTRTSSASMTIGFVPLFYTDLQYWDSSICNAVTLLTTSGTVCSSPFFTSYPRVVASNPASPYATDSYVTYFIFYSQGATPPPNAPAAFGCSQTITLQTNKGLTDSGGLIQCSIPNLQPNTQYSFVMQAVHPTQSNTALTSAALTPIVSMPDSQLRQLPVSSVYDVTSSTVTISVPTIYETSVGGTCTINSVQLSGFACISYYISVSSAGTFLGMFLVSPTPVVTGNFLFVFQNGLPSVSGTSYTILPGMQLQFTAAAILTSSVTANSGVPPASSMIQSPILSVRLLTLTPNAITSLTAGISSANPLIGNSLSIQWPVLSQTNGGSPSTGATMFLQYYQLFIQSSTDLTFTRTYNILGNNFKLNGLVAGNTYSVCVTPVLTDGVGVKFDPTSVTTSTQSIVSQSYPIVRSMMAFTPIVGATNPNAYNASYNYPIQNYIYQYAQTGSGIIITFDQPMNKGIPVGLTPPPAQLAIINDPTKWIKFTPALAAGVTFTGAWSTDGTQLTLTFTGGITPVVSYLYRNITSTATVNGTTVTTIQTLQIPILSPPDQTTMPQIGVTRINFTSDIILTNANAGTLYSVRIPSTYQTPLLGGSWNLSNVAISATPYTSPTGVVSQIQGYLSTTLPFINSGIGPIGMFAGFVHPLGEFFRFNAAGLAANMASAGDIGNSNLYTIACSSTLGFIYPDQKTGTIDFLSNFFHNPAYQPDAAVFNNYDYYSAWTLSPLTFVYTVPASFRGQIDTISCTLSTKFTNVHATDAKQNIANFVYVLDQRTRYVKVITGNRPPTINVPSPITYPYTLLTDPRKAGYDPNPFTISLDVPTQVSVKIGDPDLSLTPQYIVRVILRVNNNGLGAYVGSVYFNSSCLRNNFGGQPGFLNVSDPTTGLPLITLSSSSPSAIFLSRNMDQDSREITMNGPFSDVASILSVCLFIRFGLGDTAPYVTTFGSNTTQATVTPATGSVLSNVIVNAFEPLPALSRPFLHIRVGDGGNVGEQLPKFYTTQAQMNFNVDCSTAAAQAASPAPQLASAIITDSGDSALITFTQPVSINMTGGLALANFQCLQMFDDNFFNMIMGQMTATNPVSLMNDWVLSYMNPSVRPNPFPDMPTCMFLSSTVVKIRFARDHQVTPNSLVALRAPTTYYAGLRKCQGHNVASTASITLQAPISPLPPQIRIFGPAESSLCDDLFFSTRSTGLGGKTNNNYYTWYVDNLVLTDVLMNYATNIDGYPRGSNSAPSFTVPITDTLTLPRGVLKPSTKYTIGVTVTNYLGITSPMATHVVTTNPAPIPIVRIRTDQSLNVFIRGSQQLGSPSPSYTPSEPIVFNSVLNFSSCTNSYAKQVTYTWTVVPQAMPGFQTPPTPVPLNGNIQASMSLNQAQLYDFVTYVVTVRATVVGTPFVSGSPVLTSAFSTSFQIQPGNLTAAFVGGDTRTIAASSDPLNFQILTSDFSNPWFGYKTGTTPYTCTQATTATASSTTDPICLITYVLKCQTQSGNPCLNQLAYTANAANAQLTLPTTYTFTGTPTISFPAGTLGQDTYIFTLSVSKLTGISGSTYTRGSSPWTADSQSITVTPSIPAVDQVQPLPAPVRTLPPRFTLNCPVLNNGVVEFGQNIINHDDTITMSISSQQPRSPGNQYFYTWFITTAFNAATELSSAITGGGLDSTLNWQYGLQMGSTTSPTLTLNTAQTQNYFVPGMNYRFNVIVTEYYTPYAGNPGFGFNSSSNARCSYYVHIPPSKGAFVLSTTPYGTTVDTTAIVPYTTMMYMSARRWAHSLYGNPVPFNSLSFFSTNVVFMNYNFYIRYDAAVSGSLYTAWNGQGQNPNIRYITQGLVTDGTRGTVAVTLPAGTYYVGVLVTDIFGGRSYQEQQLVVAPLTGANPIIDGSDPSAQSKYVVQQQAALNAQLDAVNTAGGSADDTLNLLSTVSNNLNIFASTSNSFSSYPSGVTASTDWIQASIQMRKQIFDVMRTLVQPPSTGANQTLVTLSGIAPTTAAAVALSNSRILTTLNTLIASPIHLDIPLGNRVLAFLNSYYGLSSSSTPASTSGLMSLSAKEFTLMTSTLQPILQSATFSSSRVSTNPVPVTTTSRRLLAISDGSPDSARSIVEQMLRTYTQSLVYVETNVLSTVGTNYLVGGTTGITPGGGVGVNIGAARFDPKSQSAAIFMSDAYTATVAPLTLTTSQTALDFRFIYQYSGAIVFPWVAILTPPQTPGATTPNVYRYDIAPFITFDIATTAGINFPTISTQVTFSFVFPIQFTPANANTDSQWTFVCQRYDTSLLSWTLTDISTVMIKTSNPWSVQCSTHTQGTMTVTGYYNASYVPPPAASSSSTGDSGSSASSTGAGAITYSSSSTGDVAVVPLTPASSSSSKNNVTLFLIVAGAIAGGVSLLVGLLACYCHRRSREKEAQKKKLEDIRKLEQEKVQDLKRQAAATKKEKSKKAKQDASGLGNNGGSGANSLASSPLLGLNPQGGDDSGNGNNGRFGDGPEPSGDQHDHVIISPDAISFDNQDDGGYDPAMSPTSFANADDDRKRSDFSLANEAARKAEERRIRVEKRAAKKKRREERARRGQPLSDDDSPASDGAFDSEEEDMKYNRHDHVRIDMGGAETVADPLELSPDYSNLVYDPAATAAAAAELAALTGQSIEEVTAMLQAQQQAEIMRGGPEVEAALEAAPSLMTYGGPGAEAAIMAAAAENNATIEFDDVPPVAHPSTMWYDDSVLSFHAPLNNDPYLLSIYSPSYAASPSHVPPPEVLPPSQMPYRVVDTNYSRPLPPAAWRLAHGNSPYGQTISFNVDKMPRWWKHHKGLDVALTSKEKKSQRLGAKRVARKKVPKVHAFSKPQIDRMVPVAVVHKPPLMKNASARVIRMPAEPASSSSAASASSKPNTARQTSLNDLVRDQPSSSTSQQDKERFDALASPSIIESDEGFIGATPRTQDEYSRFSLRDSEGSSYAGSSTFSLGDMTERNRNRDEERRPVSLYLDENPVRSEEEGVGLMGGGSSSGGETYRGYSFFQPMSTEGENQTEGKLFSLDD